MHSPNPSPDRYLLVEEQLNDLTIPEGQQSNIQALIAYEAEYDSRPNGWAERASCADCYSMEVDKRAYLLFCNGKFAGSTNLRGMPRIIAQTREWYPDGVMLLHGMGTKVDFDLVNKAGEIASEHPENWVPRAHGKRTRNVGDLRIKIEGLDDPPDPN